MNILDAIDDENVFLPFLGRNLRTWVNWFTALRVLYGLPIGEHCHPIIQQCTGRNPAALPADGFDTALFLTGRRSGKSRVASIIGAFEAVLAGHEVKLAKGEKGVVAICAPTVRQGKIVRDYLRGVFDIPMLHAELADETREGFELKNRVRIEILAGDWRHVRGFTLLAAIVDEIAFFGFDDEGKIRSDTELIRAIQPSLATMGGKLICISSPYAKKGWCFKTYQRNWANEAGNILLWNAASRVMNPKLPQRIVDEALAEDLQAAKSEYLGEFRDDVGEYLPRSVIERVVVAGRTELLPQPARRYVAFADLSGGRADDAALAIAHREGRRVILDLLRRWRPPFNPHAVVGEMAAEIRRFNIRRCVGDNYGADFVAQAFTGNGVTYAKCEKIKSALYSELLPILCSGELELLDDDLLVSQLAGLERRVRSGGKDIIDHPPNSHDDLANAVAGVANVAVRTGLIAGAL